MINRENYQVNELKKNLSCTVKIAFSEMIKHKVNQYDVSRKYPETIEKLNRMYQRFEQLPKIGDTLIENGETLVIKDKNSDNNSIYLVCYIQ